MKTNTRSLVEHLRHAHGYSDYEPDGAAWDDGEAGFPEPLDTWSVNDLATLHEEDHNEIEGGGGRDSHTHDEADA